MLVRAFILLSILSSLVFFLAYCLLKAAKKYIGSGRIFDEHPERDESHAATRYYE